MYCAEVMTTPLSELLKQITPLPRTKYFSQVNCRHIEFLANSIYRRHAQNALPPLVKKIHDALRDAESGDKTRLPIIAETLRAALKAAEEVHYEND